MISSIDHIVLTASDLDKTIALYCDVLGMTLEHFIPSDGGEVRKSLKFGNQKINLHNAKSPFKPHANNPVFRRSGYLLFEFKTNGRVE